MIILDTERINLRQFTEDDVDRMHEIYSDINVMRYVGMGITLNKEQTHKLLGLWINEYYKNWGYGIWAVEDKSSGELIGQCGFNNLPEKTGVEIAYFFSKDYWNKGYATETASKTLEYGFGKLGFQTIFALTYPQNTASVNVLTKIGMNPEGKRKFYGIEFLFFRKDSNLNT